VARGVFQASNGCSRRARGGVPWLLPKRGL